MKTKKENLAELKEMGKTFFVDTKKQFKSCSFACVNVDDYNLYNIWGDFKSRKDAVEVIKLWGRIFKSGKIESEIFEGKYRISVNF